MQITFVCLFCERRIGMTYEHECKSLAICGWIDSMAGKILDLAYVNEGELDDLQTISEIYGLIRDIEREVSCIESSRDKYIDNSIELRQKMVKALTRLNKYEHVTEEDL